MAEEQLSQSSRILTFVSGQPELGWNLFRFSIVVLAAMIFFRGWETFESPGDSIVTLLVLIIITSIVALTVMRRWTVEVDPQARILTIFRIHTLRWTAIVLRTTIVERCSFDECSMLGTTTRGGDDDRTFYGVYLDFKRGGRHVIPVQNDTLNEAARAASELTAATGIPRLDEVR